ncbi:MAG: hypothetical protein KF753_18355 [Caldilineaceae bacterium]|nr:hypothetical protein [Caldilineaceae bacterium]
MSTVWRVYGARVNTHGWGTGGFGPWLESEFAWSDFTARQFMNVATQFKNENFSDLTIGASALYLLASPSTPDPARIEALERAEAGEVIGQRTVQDTVTRLLLDEEWGKWSDREIARQAQVSNRFVTNLRNELSVNGSQIDERKVTRNGTTYTQNTANIGQRRTVEVNEEECCTPRNSNH